MTKARITSVTVRVPAGEYWVGDPCYSFDSQETWMELLNSCDFFNSPIGVVAGTEVVAFGTHHGDGVYMDRQGRRYGVDAGLIGLVPAGVFPDPAEGLMHKVTFGRPTECSVDEDGVITFGLITIDTNPDEWSGWAEDEDEDS